MPSIPFIDLRDSSLIALAQQEAQKARNLIHASRDAFGLPSRVASYAALPIGDHFSWRWLVNTNNPYRAEIDAYAQAINHPGVYALNLCYEWGCTSGAYPNSDSVTLMRTLDWPFPALGRNMVVAHQRGAAGEFYNVTWPGISGIYQAMAPGRFALALNQAPMRRHRTGVVIDWARNRYIANQQRGLPPAHLLRLVTETAATYEDAKRMLAETPVAIPVIYTLSGIEPSQACVIERIENAHAIREGNGSIACAANHFESALNGIGRGWQARAIDSHGRVTSACTLLAGGFDDAFNWFVPPIANRYSRVVMTTDAKAGTLRVMGTEGITRVTDIFTL